MILAAYTAYNLYGDASIEDGIIQLDELIREFEKRHWLDDLNERDYQYFIEQLNLAVADLEDLNNQESSIDMFEFVNSSYDTKELKRELKTTVYCGINICNNLDDLYHDDLKRLARTFVNTDVRRVVLKDNEIVIYHKKENE